MPECSIDRNDIKTGIQNSVAKSLDASGLFDRVSPFADTVQRIQEALKYADDIDKVYKEGFKANPEDFLREIAKQATSSESEQQGALTMAGYNLFDIALELYGEGYLFAPKNTNVPFKDIIESINANYGEEVIKEVEQNGEIVYSSTPSEALINAYEREYKGEETVYDFSKKPGIKPPVPNVQSRAWKDLSKKIGPAAAYDAYIRNGYIIPVAATFEDSFRGIDASMKVIAALEKIPRTSYPSNQAEGFYNDLRKQGAPENQIDIVKNYINRHKIEEIDKVDLIAGLLTEVSFVVEINTATTAGLGGDRAAGITDSVDVGPFQFIRHFEGWYSVDEQRDAYPDEIVQINTTLEDRKKKGLVIPTNHYATMVVPGGTNYTENNINTPDITPSIRGHAAFATANGIGWFRSDVKSPQDFYQSSEGKDFKYEPDNQTIRYTTRRILEVQSDLFQKGRGKEELVIGTTLDTSFNYAAPDWMSEKDLDKINLTPENTKQNQFLQLLNKDNAWVTFFVKSIIQDSAKKGYEKVLFPSGNTANKVEGQETLEEFIKTKEDAITNNQKLLKNLDNPEEIWIHGNKFWHFPNSIGNKFSSKEDAIANIDGIKNSLIREIEQYEKEIKDAKEGRSKFVAINSFYETTVFNILKKQGYKPIRITDEYGNEWYEVDLLNTDYANERVLYGLGDIVENDMNYNMDDIYEELGLTETSTPQDFIEAHMQDYAANIANFRKANPNFKIEWGTERTQFDFTTNTIYVDLQQLNTIAKANNIPLSQVVSILILHEMGHAASYYGLETGKNDQVLSKLMEVAKNHHKTNIQFEDVLRQGFTEPDGSIYAFKDIHEFAAEAYSNPYFQEWLMSIPYEGKRNLLQAIWDAILEFFGVVRAKPTLYDAVIEYLNSDLIQRDNREGSEHPSTEWDFTVTYKEGVGAKAIPKTYTQAAFELFTNPAITNEITEIVKKLPKAVIEIKKQLDYETDKDKIKKLQSLLDAFKDVKENENVLKVSINMLIQAGFIAEDMEAQIVELKKLKDNSKKITLAHSLRNNVQALRFIEPLAQDVVRLVLREGGENAAAIRPFLRVLRGITSAVNSVDRTYVDVTQPAALEVLSEFVGETEAEKTINQTIIDLKKKLKESKDPVMQGLLDRQIELEKEKLKLVPNKANLDLIFRGLYKDSSSSQLLFEAGMANGHPIPNTVMRILRQNNINVSQTMLHVENEHQKQLDKLRAATGISAVQGIRNTETFYEPITMLVSRADEAVEEDGKITYKYTTSRMLLSEYSPDYIKEATELKVLIDYYSRKLYEADDKDDADAIINYRNKLNKVYKDRRSFYRLNSENQYDDRILDMYDMLEKEVIKPDGTSTTFGAERGYIFEAIEDVEQRRQEEFNLEVLSKLQDEIEGLYIKQKQLKSKYNEDGSEKTGFEKELSDIANAYAELKTQYGKYELTEKGKAMFEKEVLSLQKRLEGKLITQEEYDRRIGEITVTELTEEYYSTVKYYLELINEASEALSGIDEFKAIFKGVNREAIKSGYDKIRDLVRGFRDNEMTIDGQLFSKVRPELVKEIQKIQQEVENLKGISEKLRGLSIEDSIRAKELRAKRTNGIITDEELAELGEMDAKILESNRLYLKYKDLIDNYSDLLQEFSELNESAPSQYYQDELEIQKAKLVSEKVVKILDQMKTSDSLQEGKYIKEKGVWVEFGRMQGTTKVVKDIDKKGFKTVEDALANKIAREQTEDDIKLTDWWKENHYEKYKWTKKGYVKSDSPIYIWVKTEPADKEFVKEQQPSIRFKTYTINPEHHNPNFRLINDSLPAPKIGRYINKKYNDLKSATDTKSKAYSEYLEFARDAFKRAQGYVPEERKLADVLPSLVKTGDEVAVDITNSVANSAMSLLQKDASLGVLKSETLDEQTMTGGGTTDFFAKNRVLPIRFSSRIDYKTQSADIPAMLLAYELAAVEYNEQLKDQPLLEAIRTIVEKLPVLESKRLASQFSVANLFSAVKSSFSHGEKNQTKDREKKVVKSNLSQTIDHMLDTYLYGETKKSANVAIMGLDFDLHKASRGLKKISSLSIFALNAFVAVKNTISATIQGNINSNIGKGFFTKAQYNKAHLEAIGHVKDYLLDFRKFGNKTQIGQEIDFFQVLQGAAYNQYGQKTAWTILKNGQNFLTSMKNASEFELQITQYLAMSKANPVEVNGKMVEFRKAFQLNSNMDLVPVDGANVTQKQIEDFIFKLGYVNRNINGAYRAEEKNAIQKNILGDLVFYLNGYVIPGIVNRFGKTRYSAEADMITRGYINQTFAFMGDIIRYRTEILKRWEVMSTDERHRVMRGTKEILIIIAMGILVSVLGGNDDKEELLQNKAIQNWALALALAVKAETETFVPFPGMGLNEMARKMNSPFAAVRQISNILKVLQNLSLLIVGNPDAYYKSTSYKDGFHDKGDAKVVANLLKLIGWSGVAFDPVEKALQQKNIQTLR